MICKLGCFYYDAYVLWQYKSLWLLLKQFENITELQASRNQTALSTLLKLEP